MTTILSLSIGIAVTLLVAGLFRANHVDRSVRIRSRVERIQLDDETHNPYDDSLAERVLYPLMGWFTGRISTIMPSRLVQSVEENLQTAGMTLSAGRFVTAWLGIGLIAPVTLLVIIVPVTGVSLPMLGMFGAWIGGGLYIPWLLLRRRANSRSTEVDRRLPDAIDLIVTCVESGIGLQAAMMKVSEYVEGPVADEFSRVSREVSVGRARDEALEAMAERTGSREMRLFVRAIVQAEAMGISIGSVLRNQAREVRERREQRAREKANTIPVKITIPTVLFIFPTIFLLILGPVALNTIELFESR